MPDVDASASTLARRIAPVVVQIEDIQKLEMQLTSSIDKGGTSLDLSGIPLWEVPASLVELPNLVEIRIDQKTTTQAGSRCMFDTG